MYINVLVLYIYCVCAGMTEPLLKSELTTAKPLFYVFAMDFQK